MSEREREREREGERGIFLTAGRLAFFCRRTIDLRSWTLELCPEGVEPQVEAISRNGKQAQQAPEQASPRHSSRNEQAGEHASSGSTGAAPGAANLPGLDVLSELLERIQLAGGGNGNRPALSELAGTSRGIQIRLGDLLNAVPGGQPRSSSSASDDSSTGVFAFNLLNGTQLELPTQPVVQLLSTLQGMVRVKAAHACMFLLLS